MAHRPGGAVQRRRRNAAAGDRAGRALRASASARCGRCRACRRRACGTGRRWSTALSLLPLLLVLLIGAGQARQPLDQPRRVLFPAVGTAQAEPADDGWPGTCNREPLPPRFGTVLIAGVLIIGVPIGLILLQPDFGTGDAGRAPAACSRCSSPACRGGGSSPRSAASPRSRRWRGSGCCGRTRRTAS